MCRKSKLRWQNGFGFHWIDCIQVLRNSTNSDQSRALTVITVYIRSNLGIISAYSSYLVFTKALFYLVIFVLRGLLKPPRTYLSNEKYVFFHHYRKTGSNTLYPLFVLVTLFFFYYLSPSLIRNIYNTIRRRKIDLSKYLV